jgi:hypothetical protein
MSIKELTIPIALSSIFALGACAQSASILDKQSALAIARSDPRRHETPQLTRDQIIDARRYFYVEILSFDTSKHYGAAFSYSDYVKLRITNNSGVTLPYITPLVKRYNSGNAVGWSRAPVIAVHDLGPKQSKIIDYYPYGRLSVVPVDKLTVEIEPAIDEEDMRLFKELAP